MRNSPASQEYLQNCFDLDDWPIPENLLDTGATTIEPVGVPPLLAFHGNPGGEVGPAVLPPALARDPETLHHKPTPKMPEAILDRYPRGHENMRRNVNDIALDPLLVFWAPNYNISC